MGRSSMLIRTLRVIKVSDPTSYSYVSMQKDDKTISIEPLWVEDEKWYTLKVYANAIVSPYVMIIEADEAREVFEDATRDLWCVTRVW